MKLILENGKVFKLKERGTTVKTELIATHNLGAGCCWVMHFDPAAMRESYNIPNNIEPIALLVMGYPSDDAMPLDLHFKNRPKAETIFFV